jgi:hypothetical protein
MFYCGCVVFIKSAYLKNKTKGYEASIKAMEYYCITKVKNKRISLEAT